MENELRNLLALQELDLKILALNVEKEKSQQLLEDEKREYSKSFKNLETEKERLKKLQVEIKELDIDLETRQEKKRKLEAQQAIVKTNQEYRALSKEILDTQAEIRLIEDKMLVKMEEIEEEKKNNATHEHEIKRKEIELKKKSAETDTKIKSIDEELARTRSEKEQVAGKIDQRYLQVYNRIFNNKKGLAIVPIVNRTCSGCNISITTQMESTARRFDELVICENCSRILYYKGDEE